MEAVQSFVVPLPKLLLAVLGAGAAWLSFRQYRARRRDPSLPRNPVTDRWWRRFLLAAAIVVLDLVMMAAAHDTMRTHAWLLYLLFGILGTSVLVLFVAAAMLGWRSNL